MGLLTGIMAGLSALATTGSMVQANQQARKAERQMDIQNDATKAEQARLEQERADEEGKAAATEANAQAKQRQKMRAGSYGGRKDTILTSPLGSVDESQGGGKTLLGL
jgi:Flp pilus assembly protein TadB